MPANFDYIPAMLGRFCDAWQTNDGAAVASFYTQDSSLINPFGERADGRDAIAAMYTRYYGGLLAGTGTVIEQQTVRYVEGYHAFVDANQAVVDLAGNTVLTLHVALLLRLEDDRWMIVDARPYAYAAPPVG